MRDKVTLLDLLMPLFQHDQEGNQMTFQDGLQSVNLNKGNMIFILDYALYKESRDNVDFLAVQLRTSGFVSELVAFFRKKLKFHHNLH